MKRMGKIGRWQSQIEVRVKKETIFRPRGRVRNERRRKKSLQNPGKNSSSSDTRFPASPSEKRKEVLKKSANVRQR